MSNNTISEERFSIIEISIKILKPITLPKPFYDATMGPFSSYQTTILTVLDDSGYEGEIEYPLSLLPLFKEHFASVLLESKNTLYSEIYKSMFWRIRNEGFRGEAARALGYLDRVFYDIASRRKKMSLHHYLGATRNWAKVYASGGSTAMTDEGVIEECLEFQKDGYSVIKIKVGGDFGSHLDTDVKRVQKVRGALGDDISLAVDLNQALSVQQAIDFIGKIEDLNIAWVEEPIHSADINGMTELTSNTSVAIAFGESERTYFPFQLLLESGIKHFQPVANNMISLQEFFAVCDLAKAHDLALSCGSFPNVNAQLIATQKEDAMCEYLIPFLKTMESYFLIQPIIENGKAILPEIDGVSIRFDWEKLEKQDLIYQILNFKSESSVY